MNCTHMNTILEVTPSAKGCEECMKIGGEWVHLRLCRECGHVGCCDDSPHRHARAHFHATQHPIIEGYDPPEGWDGATSTISRSRFLTRHLKSDQSLAFTEAMLGEAACRDLVPLTVDTFYRLRPARRRQNASKE